MAKEGYIMKLTWKKRYDSEVCSLKFGMYVLRITDRPFTAHKYTGRVSTLSYHGKGDELQPHWKTAGNNLRGVKKKLLDKLKEFARKDIEELGKVL